MLSIEMTLAQQRLGDHPIHLDIHFGQYFHLKILLGAIKRPKKYQTIWHTRSTKPNKPSRLISPPDQPEPSDATDPQDPPEPSSQLWRFSHNFTIVNLLLPKLLPTAHGWEQGAR